MESQPLEVEKGRETNVMKCSVMILNWNGAEMLRRYLPSVVENTKYADVNIVVADNGSTDDSLQVLQDFKEVKLIKLDRNYGFAEGYNRAVDQIDSDYCVLLNSDVEVTEGWLDTLLAYMDTHQDVVACQPKILSWTDKKRFEHAGAAGGHIDRLGYPFCRGRILEYVEKDNGQYDTVADIFWASGACLCIRTAEYKALGGLDADFFAHMEEIDLCWRINCRGGRVVCVPQATVYHLGGGALNYESPRKTYLNFRNNLLMLYKNLPDNKLRKVMFMRLVLDYAAAAHLSVTGKMQNALAVFKARYDYHKMRNSEAFKAKRHDNISKATTPYPATISNRSILFDRYCRGRQTF